MLLTIIILVITIIGLDWIFHLVPRKKSRIRHFSNYDRFIVQKNGVIDMIKSDAKSVYTPVDFRI